MARLGRLAVHDIASADADEYVCEIWEETRAELTVCNRNTTAVTVRAYIGDPLDADSAHVFEDFKIPKNGSRTLLRREAIAPGEIVRVRASATGVNWRLSGYGETLDQVMPELARAKALVSPYAGFILDVAAAVKRGAIWEDTARTIAASVNGPVGSIQDELQRYYAEQATTTAKLLLRTDGAHYWLDPDHIDDNMTVPLPNGAYNVLQRTQNGVLEYKINVTGGTGWKFYVDPLYTPDDSINGILATAGPLDSTLRGYSESLGAGANFAGVTSMRNWFRGRTDITEIESGGWDTSSVATFQGAFYQCLSLTALDVSGWDTSSVTNFAAAFRGCSSLTTITTEGGTGNPFADSPCTNYLNAFLNTNLTQQTIDNILVRINAANTSNGTFTQSGGSAPSATGQAAIDALRLRGWTVTVTGGY